MRSEYYATEKIIGGLVLIGIASLLVWNGDQTPGTSPLDVVFRMGVMAGALWSAIGGFELFTGHRWRADSD